MKKINIIFFIISVLLFNSCKKAADEPAVIEPEIYKGCCGTQPVDFTVGKANIYLPNVFTPNGDGINDLFYPVVNDEVIEVQGFTIWSAVGDTLIFTRASFNYNDFKNYGWNGTRSQGDGQFLSKYNGAFKYQMRIINSEGQLAFVKGEACVIQCSKDAAIFKTKEGCYYPSQASSIGKVDKTKKSNENTCF
jgi:hypothetical protein